MANSKHLRIIKEGVSAWNIWREQHPETEPDLEKADLVDMDFSNANLSGANLSGADLSGTFLYKANLGRANLSKANFSDATANGANLGNANLSDAKLVKANFGQANLSNADLRYANLNDADFCGSDLRNANLSGAELGFAALRGTNLDGANLRDANLFCTDLFEAHLGGAILREAYLYFTMLNNVDLRGADFGGALLRGAVFANTDLSTAKGLETVRHAGPSTVGVDTIYKTKGKIPESFLRGCGVQESFFTQIRSPAVAEDGIQFYSCFISHSSKDEEFAERLLEKMRYAHLRVWYAPQDIKGGMKIHEQIETAIRSYDKLLIVLSEASMGSEWVMDELRKAFKAERQSGKRKLFPVRLTDYETLLKWECRDSASGKDLAEELRQYFIPDFSNWKEHDAFEAAFGRLLKDLKAGDQASSR